MTDEWFEIVIADKEGLSGSSVFTFVRPIIEDFGLTRVIVADLEGAIFGVRPTQGISLSAADFLVSVSQATQYDWAFFFLFRKEPPVVDLDAQGHRDDTLLIQASAITVRLVDDSYFYVYTREADLATAITRSHPVHEIRKVAFAALSIPY